MRIINNIKTYALASLIAIPTTIYSKPIFTNYKEPANDTFEHVIPDAITPQGTDNSDILKNAPNCDITIAGKQHKAGIVVDLKNNILYTYDKDGKATKAYLVASGKPSTPTPTGVCVVTHKEVYPYRSAPRHTKRYKNPKDYGPFIVCLNRVDTKTGEQHPTGVFIHGCRSYHNTFEVYPSRRVSHGCVRMEKSAITEVKEVAKGTYVLFVR